MDGSKRRDLMVVFISEFFALHGYYPTVRETAQGVGLASSALTHEYLCDLVEEGRLRRMKVTSRVFVFALPEDS